MLTLMWKEWRENRALLLAVVAIAAAMAPAMQLLELATDAAEDWVAAQIVLVVLSAFLGGNMIAHETGRGTLDLLFTRPVARWKVWASKGLFGLLACMAVGLVSSQLTLSASGRPADVPEAVVGLWPLEAALAFSAGFYFSSLFSHPLAGGLLGLASAALAAALLIAAPVRLALFWPALVVAFFAASWWTFSGVLVSDAGRRMRSALAGAVLGALFLPVVYLSGTIVSELSGPRAIVHVESADLLPFPGSHRLVVEVETRPSLAEPLRAFGEKPFAEEAEVRLLVLDTDSGDRRWLAPREVGSWKVMLSGSHLVGVSAPRGPESTSSAWSLDAEAGGDFRELTVPGGPDEFYRTCDWMGFPSGGEPIRTTFHGQRWFMERGRGEPATLTAGEACATPGLELPWKPGDQIPLVTVLHRSSRGARSGVLLASFRREAPVTAVGEGPEGWWEIDLKAASMQPIVPRMADGTRLTQSSFQGLLPDDPKAPVLFLDRRAGIGQCAADGSGARLVEMPGADPSAWGSATLSDVSWSHDRKVAAFRAPGAGQGPRGDIYHLDVATGIARKLETPPGLDRLAETLVPAETGVHVVGNDYETGAGHLWWIPLDGSGPVELARPGDRLVLADCDHHAVVHPFVLLTHAGGASVDGLGGEAGAPTAGDGRDRPWPPLYWWWRPRSCVFYDRRGEPPVLRRELLVLRPPDRGGLVRIAFGEQEGEGPVFLAPMGARALTMFGGGRFGMVDAQEPEPRLRELRPHAAGLPEVGRVVWTSPERALVLSRHGVWRIDAASLEITALLLTDSGT